VKPEQRFGRNLRAERERQGLSQEDLAGRAKLHSTEISRLERGVRDQRLSTISRLARALKVSAAHLLDGV
jgi:transcriptional regulator with XRE-family HTH domain